MLMYIETNICHKSCSSGLGFISKLSESRGRIQYNSALFLHKISALYSSSKMKAKCLEISGAELQ